MTHIAISKKIWTHCCAALLLIGMNSCGGLSKNKSDEDNFSLKEVKVQLEVKKYKLPNGLRILVVENHKLPIFTYQTFFDVGGRHEGAGTTGATHFLEHMMFKGAKKYGEGVFSKLIESNGGNSNAYTNFDNTVYYESLPVKSGEKEMLPIIVDLEADRMQHLTLDPVSFEKERQVIMEERKMRYENSPNGQLWLSITKNMFEGSPYGGSVIGDKKDLESLSRDQVMNYFKNFYRPDNAIIVVVGDVDAYSVYRLIKEKYRDIKSSNKAIREYRDSRDNSELYKGKARYGRHVKISNKQAISPMFMLGFPGSAAGTKEGFVQDLLASVIGQGESSYLNELYVTSKRPIFTSISASNYNLKHNGIFLIGGEVARGKNLKKTTDALINETKSLCETAITERSLQKTKNRLILSYISNVETNDGVAQFLGMREAYFKDYEFYKKEIEVYNNITLEELKSSCRGLFKDGKHILVSIWNKHPLK